MAKSNKQIDKEAQGQETTLAVVDYRMGQLEIAVKEGFAAHDQKLDGLTNSFASKEDFMNIQRQLDGYKWFFRALVVAVFTSLATAAAGLLVRK